MTAAFAASSSEYTDNVLMMQSVLTSGTATCLTTTTADGNTKFADGFNVRIATRNVEENVKLIDLIKQRPILYDSSLLGYKDVIKKENAWLNIAMAMDWPVELCQTRWKSLRDSYRKKDKKSSPDPTAAVDSLSATSVGGGAHSAFSVTPSAGCGGGGIGTTNGSTGGPSTWRYAEMLSFLKNKNYRRKTTNGQAGNRSSAEDAADSSDHTDHEPSSAAAAVAAVTASVISAAPSALPSTVMHVSASENGLSSGGVNFAVAASVSAISASNVEDAPPLDFSTNGATQMQRFSPKNLNKHKRKSSTAYNSSNRVNGAAADSPLLSKMNDAPDHHNHKRVHYSPGQTPPPPPTNSRVDERPHSGHEIRLIKRDFDEDDMFGLAIAAALKRCPDDHRLAAKIEIMRLLHLLQQQQQR